MRPFFLPQFDEFGLENMWFQQDDAAAHTASFPGRSISRFSDLYWPARSLLFMYFLL